MCSGHSRPVKLLHSIALDLRHRERRWVREVRDWEESKVWTWLLFKHPQATTTDGYLVSMSSTFMHEIQLDGECGGGHGGLDPLPLVFSTPTPPIFSSPSYLLPFSPIFFRVHPDQYSDFDPRPAHLTPTHFSSNHQKPPAPASTEGYSILCQDWIAQHRPSTQNATRVIKGVLKLHSAQYWWKIGVEIRHLPHFC